MLILGIFVAVYGTACASEEQQQAGTISEQAVLRDRTYSEDETEYKLSKEDTVEIRELLSEKSGWKETKTCECIGSYELILDEMRCLSNKVFEKRKTGEELWFILRPDFILQLKVLLRTPIPSVRKKCSYVHLVYEYQSGQDRRKCNQDLQSYLRRYHTQDLHAAVLP